MQHYYLGPADYPIWLAALVAIATGLPLWPRGDEQGDEQGVWTRLPAQMRSGKGWRSREMAGLFTQLGYNCSPNFKARFDRRTPYPCLMRFSPINRALVRERQAKGHQTAGPAAKGSSWWNVLVYYDGLVYDPACPEPYALERFSPEYHITTMMQVWIGA